MSRKDEAPEIVRVAQSLEQQLQRLEDLSRSALGARLNTDKNIARAGRTLQEAVAQQEQLALGLGVLGEVMLRMQARQQAAIESLALRAQAIQQQAHLLGEHMQRFAALGTKAAEATQLLQGSPEASDGDATTVDTPGALASVEDSLLAISEEAKALVASADAADLSDVSKEAASLRQRIDSARSRLSLALRASKDSAS